MNGHNKKNKTRIVSVIISVSVLLLHTVCITPRSFSIANLLPLQKGMSYATWTRDQFASQYSDESLEKLVSMGVEYISVCPTHYQEKYNSITIKQTNKTPSRKSLVHVITKAHELGLKIMFKPHIDLINKFGGTYWRADIGFAHEKDWEDWFKNYKNMIISYAKLSERLGIEIFCIGTELSFATTKDLYWNELIFEIRKVYSGKLVYAANWDNYKNINFWDKLDYVGIDAYFPLTYKTPPSIEDLKDGWKKWKQEIEVWQAKINKRILFTEIGYPCTSHAAYAPWQNAASGNAAPEIQANCYKAFFESVWREKWLAGVYWWKWDTNVRAGGENNRQFTPQNKLAQTVIEANYKNYNMKSAYVMGDAPKRAIK